MLKRPVMLNIIILQLLAIFALLTCKTNEKALIEFQELTNSAVNPIDFILSELSHKKIIFISENHMWTNEEEFLADSIESFYEAGVRYLFLEGGIPDFSIPGHKVHDIDVSGYYYTGHLYDE
jgi:hypothetical protein